MTKWRRAVDENGRTVRWDELVPAFPMGGTMNDKLVKEAAKVIGKSCGCYDNDNFISHDLWVAARALHAAGLLASPEMRELCEATVEYSVAQDPNGKFRELAFTGAKGAARFWDAVAALRAAKQPKPRWRVLNTDALSEMFKWAVLDGQGNDARAIAYFRTEADANAERDRRNALASESPR